MVCAALLDLHVHPPARIRHGPVLHRPGEQSRRVHWLLDPRCYLCHHPHHQRHAEKMSRLSSKAFKKLGLLTSLDALAQANGQVSL